MENKDHYEMRLAKDANDHMCGMKMKSFHIKRNGEII